MILIVAKPHLAGTPRTPFIVSATDKNGRVQLQWNSQSDTIDAAQGAVLDVTENGAVHRYPVDYKVLKSGALDYLRNGDDATVSMTLFRDGQAIGQAVIRSIGPVASASLEPVKPRSRRSPIRN